MALKFNTFRAQRYLRSKFVEGKFLLAAEATDLELEILDLLRQQVKELFGEAVAVEDAWKVERLNETQLLIKPGEAWVQGLPVVMRGGKDQLVSGSTLSIGTVPLGVSVADDASGDGKVLTFGTVGSPNSGNVTPTGNYRIVVTAKEELITEVQDPFLQNVNLTESTQQKIRLVFQINIVPESIQTESPVPYRDENSVGTDAGLTPTNFPDTGNDNQPNLVNEVTITPTSGVGEFLSLNSITGSEGIDGKDLELIIANPLGNNPIPNTPSSQAAFSNGSLIDSNGTQYHINFITNDAVGGQVKIVIDKEYQQPDPVIDAPGGRPYTIVKRAVFVTDDVNGVPQGKLHWPVATLTWNTNNGIVHDSSVVDLRKEVRSVQGTQETLADKLDLFLVAGGNLHWDSSTSLLTWSATLKLVSPYGPVQTISATSAPLVDGGALIYEMDLASGGAIEKGTTAISSTSTGTSIALTGSPDLSAVRVGNVVVDDNGNVASITAIDDVNDVLTVDSALTFSASGNIHLDSYAPQTAPRDANNFVLAVRDGSKVYVGINDLELESGETNQLGDGISSQNLTYIGATNEADNDPNYSSTTVITQGANLTQTIGELDAGLDALTTTVSNIQWKNPVADFATLPAVGNVDGDVRLVLDTRVAYHWDNVQSLWLPLTSSGSGIKLIGGGTVTHEKTLGTSSDTIENTADVSAITLNENNYGGQTFTTIGPLNVDEIEVKLYSASGFTGPLTIDIYPTSGGEPDTTGGPIVSSESVDGATLTTSTAGAPVIFNFSTPANLLASTQYAFVINPSAGSGAWSYRSAQSFTYTDGEAYNSSNLTTWNPPGADFYFIIRQNVVAPGDHLLYFSEDLYLEKPSLNYTDNTIPTTESPITLVNDKDVAYVLPNLIPSNTEITEFNTNYFTAFNSEQVSTLKVVGNRLYAVNNTSKQLVIIDITDPANPIQTNTVVIPSIPNNLAQGIYYDSVLNKLSIRFNGNPSVHSLSLADPDNPTDIQNEGTAFGTAVNYRHVGYRQGRGFTLGATTGDPQMYIYDLEGGGPTQNVPFPSLTNGSGGQRVDFSSDNNTIYAASGQELHIFDLTTITAVTAYSSLNLGGDVGEVVNIDDTYVAVPVRGTNNVVIIDVSNPNSPSVNNTIVLPGAAQTTGTDRDTINFDGTNLIINKSGEVNIVDVSDPTTPIIIDTLVKPVGSSNLETIGKTNLIGALREDNTIDFWQNTLTANQNLTVIVDTLPNVPPTATIVARLDENDIIVGTSSMRLVPNESKKLYAGITDQEKNKMYAHKSSFWRSDDPITWTGSDIIFSTDLVLEMLKEDGTTQTYTVATADSPISLVNGQYAYLIVDRTQNTQTLSLNVGTAPAEATPGLEVIILGKRQDVAGSGYLHLPLHKQVLEPGQTVRLGASGTGGASGEILETVKNRLIDSVFEAVTPNIFLEDKDTYIDGSSTGTFSVVKSNFEFSTAAETFVSTQMLDDEFLTNGEFLNTAELLAFWNKDAIDTGATYEISRNGGNEWQTITMERIAGTELYRGYHDFDPEATNQTVDSQAVGGSFEELNPTTQKYISAALSITNTTEIRAVDLNLTVNDSGALAGKLFAAIYDDNSGSPGRLIAETVAIDVPTLVTGANTIDLPYTVLTPGTYHLVLRTDAEYDSTFVTGVDSIAITSNGSGTGGRVSSDGSTWGPGSTFNLLYTLAGIEYDLRIRITSSTAANLDATAVLYDRDVAGISTGVLEREVVHFKAVADNLNEFTLTSMVPDSNLLRVYYVQAGQVFTYPAFSLQGNKVVFTTNQFNNGGVETDVTLVFDQTRGGAFDNSDLNGLLLANNHLGSTDPAVDKSSPGRGIFLRRPDGTLREVRLDNADQLIVDPS